MLEGDGPLKATILLTYEEADVQKKAYGYTFLHVAPVVKGTTKMDLEYRCIYKVTSVEKKTAALIKNNDYAASVVVPDTFTIAGTPFYVTKIADGAFQSSKKLKKIVIGTKVGSIGKKAFYGCKKLKLVTIRSKKIKSIRKNAFQGVGTSAVIKVPKAKKKAYTKLLKSVGFQGAIV